MKLTTRDFEILEFLSAQGVATPTQLRERFFPSRISCDKRLHFLKSVDLVESCSVPGLRKISPESFQALTGLLGAGGPDLWKYRVYRLGPKFSNRRIGNEHMSDVRMWKHQLQLNRIRKVCEDLFPGALILNDPDVRQEWARMGGANDVVIPDLVIRKGSLEIAVELERSLKSSRIYFERFQSYRISAYTHVVYFCETDLIFKKVADLAANFKKIAVASLLMKRTVFQERAGFQPLHEFLAQPA